MASDDPMERELTLRADRRTLIKLLEQAGADADLVARYSEVAA